MEVVFVYKGNIAGNGVLHNTPSTGDFVNISGCIFQIESVMFNFDVMGRSKVSAVVYLKDVTQETKEKLEYC